MTYTVKQSGRFWVALACDEHGVPLFPPVRLASGRDPWIADLRATGKGHTSYESLQIERMKRNTADNG